MKTITITEEQLMDLAIDISHVSIIDFSYAVRSEHDSNVPARRLRENIEETIRVIVKTFINQLEEK